MAATSTASPPREEAKDEKRGLAPDSKSEEKKLGCAPSPSGSEEKSACAVSQKKKKRRAKLCGVVSCSSVDPCRETSVMTYILEQLHSEWMTTLYSCLSPTKLGTLSIEVSHSTSSEVESTDLHLCDVVWTLGVENGNGSSHEAFLTWLRREFGIWISKRQVVLADSEIRVTISLLWLKLIINKCEALEKRYIQQNVSAEKKREEEKREKHRFEESLQCKRRNTYIIAGAICAGAALVGAATFITSSSSSRRTLIPPSK